MRNKELVSLLPTLDIEGTSTMITIVFLLLALPENNVTPGNVCQQLLALYL